MDDTEDMKKLTRQLMPDLNEDECREVSAFMQKMMEQDMEMLRQQDEAFLRRFGLTGEIANDLDGGPTSLS